MGGGVRNVGPEMRRRARAYAIERFHPEAITGQYLEVYEKALT
jgi:glycosyltransferase involved in cell wall biosynthesis